MKEVSTTMIRLLLIAFVSLGFVGCDMLEDVFENENEVSGAVEEVGADYLVVEANRYTVTESTTFEGVSSLADIDVGDEVEVEYEENGSSRTALEIESGPDDD